MTVTSRSAHLERERRFLLPSAPEPVPGGVVRRIADTSLRGSRLRLRRVPQDGVPDVHELEHKVRPDAAQPSTVEHTTLYPDRAEYELLHGLPGDTLTKTRTSVPWGDLTPRGGEAAGEVLSYGSRELPTAVAREPCLEV